jgi:hypothetical protein
VVVVVEGTVLVEGGSVVLVVRGGTVVVLWCGAVVEVVGGTVVVVVDGGTVVVVVGRGTVVVVPGVGLAGWPGQDGLPLLGRSVVGGVLAGEDRGAADGEGSELDGCPLPG